MQSVIFGHHSLLLTYLTTISTEPKILWEFGLQKLKTCSLYHENLFIQKVKVISTQVLNNFFSASDIMEAVRGRFHFYGINYKGCVIQVVLLRNKWVEQLLVYFYNTAVENNFLIITRNSTTFYKQSCFETPSFHNCTLYNTGNPRLVRFQLVRSPV